MKLKHQFVLAIFASMLFVIYLYLGLVSPEIFFFPDEVVNYNFAKIYSQTGELSYSENLNYIADGIIHPVNEVFVNGKIVSAKFLGLPLIYGTIAVMVPEILRVLTPLLAVIGVIFFYLLIRDIFNSKLALISIVLMGIMPIYWYWSSFSMIENVPGFVILIISLRYFFRLLNTNEISCYVLSGLFFGLSLLIRPDYILFAIPLLIIILCNIKKIKRPYAIFAFFSLLASFGSFFILNNQLYGSPLLTGQHVKAQISRVFMVSGFRIDNILQNSINLINLTPIVFLCSLLGAIYLIRNKGVFSKYMVFSIATLLIFSLYYLNDPVVGTKLHSVYGRYLMPALMLFPPFISYLIYNFKQKLVGLLLVFVMVVINVLVVLPVINDNLKSIEDYAKLRSEVAYVTEPDAVIFLEYWDKAIFPERRVALVRELPEDNRAAKVSEIAIRVSDSNVPVYLLIDKMFVTLVNQEELIQETTAKGYGLVETGVENLYKLEKFQE